MDTLAITGLSVNTQIGVYAWEQKIKQKLVLDITIPADFSQCNDDLNKTIDYAKLCRLVTEYVEGKSFQLIETVVYDVANLIQQEFKIEQVIVAVSKPHAVKNAGNIQVVTVR